MIGAEGLLGVVALVAFIKSLVEPPTHVVVVHGRLVEQQSSIHPSWGWLCIVLGIALFAEARAVHRLLRARGPEPELIRLTPKQRASSTCGRAPLPRDPYAETAPYPQFRQGFRRTANIFTSV